MFRKPRAEANGKCERTVSVVRDNVSWVVRVSAEELILGPQAPDWFALEHDPRAVQIKAGRSRMTWRVRIGDTTVFAKVCDRPRLADRLRGWAVGNPSQREWLACRKAEAREVPTVRPLAVGVSAGRHGVGLPSGPVFRSVFLSEGLSGARRLSQVWADEVGCRAAQGRRAYVNGLIEAVARLFALAHERGFAHGDAHPDNILVTATTGAWDVRFVDVVTARVSRPPLRLRLSLRSLAQLDQAFRRLATRADRLRFLRHYLVNRAANMGKPLPGSPRGAARVRGHRQDVNEREPRKERKALKERKLVERLAQVSAAHSARLARHRDHRLRRNGKYFATLRLGNGWRATVVLKLARRHTFPEPDVPDRTEAQWRTVFDTVIAQLSHSAANRDSFCAVGLCVESAKPGPWAASVLGSPQRARFEACHKLRHRDQPSDLVVAYAEHRRAGLIDRTLLIRPSPNERNSESSEVRE